MVQTFLPLPNRKGSKQLFAYFLCCYKSKCPCGMSTKQRKNHFYFCKVFLRFLDCAQNDIQEYLCMIFQKQPIRCAVDAGRSRDLKIQMEACGYSIMKWRGKGGWRREAIPTRISRNWKENCLPYLTGRSSFRANVPARLRIQSRPDLSTMTSITSAAIAEESTSRSVIPCRSAEPQRGKCSGGS